MAMQKKHEILMAIQITLPLRLALRLWFGRDKSIPCVTVTVLRKYGYT